MKRITVGKDACLTSIQDLKGTHWWASSWEFNWKALGRAPEWGGTRYDLRITSIHEVSIPVLDLQQGAQFFFYGR